VGENNCENDGATLLDNLQSLLKAQDASSQNPSTSHDTETPDKAAESFHVAKKNRCCSIIEAFSLACVSGSIANRCFVVLVVMHARHT
jgi:hypothetical protein